MDLVDVNLVEGEMKGVSNEVSTEETKKDDDPDESHTSVAVKEKEKEIFKESLDVGTKKDVADVSQNEIRETVDEVETTINDDGKNCAMIDAVDENPTEESQKHEVSDTELTIYQELQTYKEGNAQLEEIVRKLLEEVDERREELEEEKVENLRHEHHIENLMNEIKSLRSEVDEAYRTEEELEKQKIENLTQALQIENLESEVEALKSQNKETRTRTEEEKRKLQEENMRRLKIKEQEMSCLQNKLNEMIKSKEEEKKTREKDKRNQMSTKEEEIAKLKSEFKENTKSRDEKIRSLEKDLKEKLRMKDEKIKLLEQDVGHARDRTEQLRNKMKANETVGDNDLRKELRELKEVLCQKLEKIEMHQLQCKGGKGGINERKEEQEEETEENRVPHRNHEKNKKKINDKKMNDMSEKAWINEADLKLVRDAENKNRPKHRIKSTSDTQSSGVDLQKKSQTLRFVNNQGEVDDPDDDTREKGFSRQKYGRKAKQTVDSEEDVTDGKKLIIFSTSITKDIDVRRFQKSYTSGTVRIQKFHGGRTLHFQDYLPTHLYHEKPDTVILQCGGNDLPTPRHKNVPLTKIADQIIDAGLVCKEFGVQDILIGGVTTRNTNFLKKRCSDLNEILVNLCSSHGFTFIDNSSITPEEHMYDGQHLNSKGTSLLSNNYLEALYDVHFPS